MESEERSLLEQLIYSTDENYVVSHISNIENPLILHFFAANYNWNNGFNIPEAILENKYCDFGTGLLMFYHADGYRMLENPEEVSNSSLERWKNYLYKAYNKLLNTEFGAQNISFDPELTTVEKFKLKKNKIDVPDFIIEESPGEKVEIPKI